MKEDVNEEDSEEVVILVNPAGRKVEVPLKVNVPVMEGEKVGVKVDKSE